MSTEALSKILEALETQATLNRAFVEANTAMNERLLELADNIIDLSRRIEFVARRAALIMGMKAVTLTTECRRCGTHFAQEPGPELCGPCWTELGRPERYLANVTPAPSTERNEPA